jgi:hypothetical protein
MKAGILIVKLSAPGEVVANRVDLIERLVILTEGATRSVLRRGLTNGQAGKDRFVDYDFLSWKSE